jgi:DNA-nicking Smr family endonuclease
LALFHRLKAQKKARTARRRPEMSPEPRDSTKTLLSDVKPLDGARRVPRARHDADVERHGRRHVRASETSHKPPAQFIVRRDDGLVEGYREDAGERALDPLRRFDWTPEERVDLHGRRATGLVEELAAVVRDRAARGVRRLLFIHGKGLHSRGRSGVLAEVVVEALTETAARGLVRAFRTAPLALGGAGALAVELERKR